MKATPKSCHCHSCRHNGSLSALRFHRHQADRKLRHAAKRMLAQYCELTQILLPPGSHSIYR